MNVFAKNTTSAPITVAGHKVYYIDSTDAEIVEVEKQGGGGSTASDDATGTISGVTLPTAHSYTGVSFDSLRYYAKGTLSNTGYIDGTAFGQYGRWFYGTLTWEDATLGDLTSKITTNSASSSVLLKQQYFRIIFIYDGAISGVHPSDTSESTGNQITEYSYNDGVHSIRFYAQSSNWYNGQSSGRIQFRYLDGITTFNNLSAFDLVNVSDGALSKATTTDRYDMYSVWGGNITIHAVYAGTVKYNAFKYTLSGTPYWYVIDGEHDMWTDDLSAWGYSEVPVGPVLPEVKQVKASGNGWGYLVSNLSDTSVSIANNEKASLYFTANTNVWGSSSLPYSVGMLQSPSGTDIGTQGVIIDTSENVVKCKNVSGSSLSITRMTVYYCNDSTATVITVYNSSNVAYNAFKFTANNTDYYYVLDGTQTDWTDDLSSIGYHIPLPTVTLDAGWCSITPNHIWLPSDDTRQAVYWRGYWSSWFYDSSKAYAAWWWRSESESAYYGTVLSNNGDGYFGITNVLGRGISSYIESRYATCESPDAVAIQVLNSSNVAYAAFKYTRGGTDYYYVLDETQTDWVDDLAGIGYRESMEVFFYLRADHASAQFSANDYWSSVVIDSADKATIEAFGVQLKYLPATADYDAMFIIDKSGNSNFTLAPIGLYSGVRTGDNGATMSNFYCAERQNSTDGPYSGICIWSINAFSGGSVTWKCRITKRISGNRIMAYMSSTKATVNWSSGYGEGLYDDNGNFITYDVSRISDIIYYSGPSDSGTPLPGTGIVIQNSSSSEQVWMTNNTGANITVQCLSFVLLNS